MLVGQSVAFFPQASKQSIDPELTEHGQAAVVELLGALGEELLLVAARCKAQRIKFEIARNVRVAHAGNGVAQSARLVRRIPALAVVRGWMGASS